MISTIQREGVFYQVICAVTEKGSPHYQEASNPMFVPSHWQSCAIALAKLCHRIGKVVPSYWHKLVFPIGFDKLIISANLRK
ncbi:hypothetical protein E5355_13100 [Bacteroides muris (ex Afrizal et al. 2022)]|uniref:Uncharacterized protein n=1 Tax=Bacteroides muris (ex Afrizal et al. 2022) TaxID=2516960 RepID=A0A4S2AN65_9BACE|nr:hypothetical protein E5355_13100 [Bacteroides muris (ex Afrizal et al. 2022)]